MEFSPIMLLIVCPLALLAAFIDSAAGGGGLISLPAYYLAGLPPYLAAGTNKLSAGLGAVASTIKFFKEKKMNIPVALIAAAMAFPGSALGVQVQHMIPENYVRIMMVCVIPLVALVVLFRRKEGKALFELSKGMYYVVSALVGLVVGFYDGLVGPGTGTFLILGFTLFLGMDSVNASGTAKVVNLSSNIAALTSYILSGEVMFALGIPAAICAIIGNWLGAKTAISHGAGFIRKMLLVVLSLLLLKMIYDLFV